jgi:hypothetical protein
MLCIETKRFTNCPVNANYCIANALSCQGVARLGEGQAPPWPNVRRKTRPRWNSALPSEILLPLSPIGEYDRRCPNHKSPLRKVRTHAPVSRHDP